MSPRRLASLVLTIPSLALLVVALGALDFRFEFPGNGGSLGAMFGVSLRTYLDHRERGDLYAIARAVLVGGMMLGTFTAIGAAAIAIAPAVDDLAGAAWLLLAGATVLGGVAAAMWERDRRTARATLLFVWGVGLCMAGVVSLTQLSAASIVGGTALVVGVPMAIYGLVEAHQAASAARETRQATAG